VKGESSFEKLKEILDKFGSKETGQICQNLLALCFVDIGVLPSCIDVRNHEGIDIIIDDQNFGKIAIEVKTTSGSIINLGNKDYEGLDKYRKNGYIAVFAILKIDRYGEWIFYEPWRKVKSLSVGQIYNSGKFKFAEMLNDSFEKLLNDLFDDIMNFGCKFLDKKLKEMGLKYSG
jgi:Holliday junction resolvase